MLSLVTTNDFGGTLEQPASSVISKAFILVLENRTKTILAKKLVEMRVLL